MSTSVFNVVTIRMRIVFIVAVLLTVCSTQSIPRVYAAGISVNTTDDVVGDDGVCSLREAIIAANSNTQSGAMPGECIAGDVVADTITIPAGLYTLTLGSELLIDSHGITLNGAGEDSTIIQASTCDPTSGACTPADYRVLHIISPQNTTYHTDINDLTIQHGHCDGTCNPGTVGQTSSGGGIAHEYASVELTNVTLTRNWANGGGGYAAAYGSVLVESSTLSYNIAQSGGGGLVSGRAVVSFQNSEVSYNKALYYDGGGINFSGGILFFDASIAAFNTARRNGGGIQTRGEAYIRQGSVIHDNEAGERGGGLSTYQQVSDVRDSIFDSNQATYYGGGIYSDVGRIEVNGTTFSNNHADSGGGYYAVSQSQNYIYTSKFLNNTATTDGGAYFFASGQHGVTTSCIVGNSDNAVAGWIYSWDFYPSFAGNWWGATDGPGPYGPGSGDTLYEGQVWYDIIYAPFATTPLLDCPYDIDLDVTKTNDVSGSTQAGSGWTWSLTVNNTQKLPASFSDGEIILTDELPAGPIYSNVQITAATDITESVVGALICEESSGTLSCYAAPGETVDIGALTGSFTVTIDAVSSAAGVFSNPDGGICRVDPDTIWEETDETNNDCADSVEVTKAPAESASEPRAVSAPAVGDPAISKRGSVDQAQAGETIVWTVEVFNPGSLPTENSVYMRDFVPDAFLVTGVSVEGDGVVVSDDQSIEVSIGVLEPGERVTITITTIAQTGVVGQVCNTAEANFSGAPNATDCVVLGFPDELPPTGGRPFEAPRRSLALLIGSALGIIGSGAVMIRRRRSLT